MKESTGPDAVQHHLRELQQVVSQTLETLHDDILETGEVLIHAVSNGHKVLAFGNGGSASQDSHLAGELLGRYAHTRKSLPAIALSSDPAVVSCIANDFEYGALFERQIEALANPADVAIGFTTSGKSANVLRGLAMAEKQGAATIALTGAAGVAGEVRYLLRVPSSSAAHIQELHLMILHIWCHLIDLEFAK